MGVVGLLLEIIPGKHSTLAPDRGQLRVRESSEGLLTEVIILFYTSFFMLGVLNIITTVYQLLELFLSLRCPSVGFEDKHSTGVISRSRPTIPTKAHTVR